MRNHHLIGLAACIGFIGGPAAGAEETVKTLLQTVDEPAGHELVAVLLLGTSKGFLQANTYLVQARNESPLYCQPPQLELTEDQLVSMLRQAAAADPPLGDKTVPDALLTVLQKTFPCNANAK
jgi:hypothetical protein